MGAADGTAGAVMRGRGSAGCATGERTGERGSALLTAVLVAFLVTVAAVALVREQRLLTQRVGNTRAWERGVRVALGGEAWARGVLARDGRETTTDHPGEPWAAPMTPGWAEGVRVRGEIQDLQGRFNLNGLLKDGAAEPLALARFRTLLTVTGGEPELAQGVVDWLDPDTLPRWPGGAEDADYQLLQPPRRAADRPFNRVAELALVRGFDAPLVARLTPLVSALPGATPINVNSAPPGVLMALAPGITKEDARALVALRGEKGFSTVHAFLAAPPLAGRGVRGQGLAVASDWFRATIRVEVDPMMVTLSSLLYRREGVVTVVERTLGTP